MDFCGSDNGDGCGRSFPNKSSAGLCAKCAKLASLMEGSADYDQWKSFKQCESCGIAWKHLEAPKCGRCANVKAAAPYQPAPDSKAPDTQALVHNAVEVSRAARSHAMDARMTKQPVAQQLHTTAGLTAAKSNMVIGDSNVFITAQCRIKSMSVKDQKNTDPGCGQWGKPWPKDAYMSEVLDDYLATLNVRWVNEMGMALVLEEVEFRWAGNKLFLPGDVNKSVGEVYTTYLTGDMAHYYSVPGPSTKKAASSQPQYSMALELYIDQPKFIRRRRSILNQGQPSTNINTSLRKRSGTATEANDAPLPKRLAVLKASGGTESTFIRTNRTDNAAINTSTVVQLKKAHTTCGVETGEVEIVWPDNAAVCEGVLRKEIFASGATKNVYKLSIGSDLYVAKRFFEIGSGKEVTADENTANLENELIRLKNVDWFLSKFKILAKDHGLEFSSDIVVSEGFLVREIGEPSPASSLPPFGDDSAVWLVEPRRTKAVRKYSGTLVHPNRVDQLGQTLSAFAHFVYECSGKELVVADIQGSPMTIQGVDTLILFDPMSHSRQSDSGIGDHGPAGIDAFITQHTCNYICQGMKLVPLLEAESQGSEEDELDGDQ